LFLSWYLLDVLIVPCSSSQPLSFLLILLFIPKQLLLFFVILLFILSNCCCSFYSCSTIIAPLPDVLVYPQQLLFLIIFFIFSPTLITLCALVISQWTLDPHPTIF
jgi:hypothetical protein